MTDDAPISLLIVDDHPVVRDGLRGMFASAPGFTVVGEAANGVEAVERVAALDPDVILMDLRMPGGGGVDAIAELTRRRCRARVLVLTTYDTDSDTLPAIEAGATGYLLKDAPRDDLFTAVRAAAEGRTVLSPAVASRLVSAVRAPASAVESLSAREREVLVLVARGTSNREIARELFISEATVKTHLTHVYGKLGVKDRAAAVATAYERGILGRPSAPGGHGPA
ncbi:response regulator [Streptomyces sp. NPDC127038]|uniref:response regulator n=1 Tax=Streptomyces sp. NPDC127038 TaxID=3347114 RepID=UPI003664C520